MWQEDRGFRLAEIRNRAIAASGGAYCVFLDGDCIARPDFVAAHRALAEPGWFVAGNRVLMSRALTERSCRQSRAGTLELCRLGGARVRGRASTASLPLLRLPLGPLRKLRARRWQGVRGGNLAFLRGDLERVDGFDAAFTDGAWRIPISSSG